MHEDKRGTGVSQAFGIDEGLPASHNTNKALAPAVGQTCGAEKRSSQRRRVLKGAEIAHERITQNIPCQIKNISDTGLMLQVDGQYQVPDQFKLIVPMDGYSVPCEKVRAEGEKIGVRFIGEKSELDKAERNFGQPTAVPLLDAFRRRQQELAAQNPSDTSTKRETANLISQFRSEFGRNDE